jgi:hypothetical protein
MRWTRFSCPVLALAMLAACGADPVAPADAGPGDSGPPAADYASVATIIGRACSFATCHGGTGMGASQLNFAAALADGTPYTELLVDQPACQYSAMDLVEPCDPDASWLMIKLVGPHTSGRIDFTPDASWDPGIARDAMGRYPRSECPLTVSGEISFGVLMPQGTTTGLTAPEVATFRAWIEAGAPGPG